MAALDCSTKHRKEEREKKNITCPHTACVVSSKLGKCDSPINTMFLAKISSVASRTGGRPQRESGSCLCKIIPNTLQFIRFKIILKSLQDFKGSAFSNWTAESFRKSDKQHGDLELRLELEKCQQRVASTWGWIANVWYFNFGWTFLTNICNSLVWVPHQQYRKSCKTAP